MLFCAVGLLAASAAMAGVPSAGTSTGPTPANGTAVGAIVLGAQTAGVADPRSNFTYTIRDASSNPVPGSVMIFNFAACGPDVKLSATSQGGTVNCGAHTITGVTNGVGQLTLSIVGFSSGAFPTFIPTITGSCVSVTADGVALSNVRASTADLDAAGGVGGLDVSACFGDQIHAPTTARADLDNSGTVGGLDVSAVFGYQTHGGSAASGTGPCP